ncbi:hypothetical protein F8153_09490 [Alkaliphilus serpentinus]|uniref:Oxaloacetate decarboxylase, gamma chain n=1 Tax=Alkaliphilus serpentinus TaxID=1482731 RepID=A0A833M725_9FIRM|nr:hypothetical protein F8153_09490 [Alkaliphilus serpentinus]
MGLNIMLYGMGTTFSILIIFYFLIKVLAKLFPSSSEK